MIDPGNYSKVEISSWDELISVWKCFNILLKSSSYEKCQHNGTNNQMKNWIYRGQKRYQDQIFTSSLERAYKEFNLEQDTIRDREKEIIREFKRKYHHYSSDIPNDDDNLEWMSIMQHYGAPTRLLDWTYSFFVAVYFAIENVKEHNINSNFIFECDVWALNSEYFSAKTVLKPEGYKQIERECKRYMFVSSQYYNDERMVERIKIIDYLISHPLFCVHAVNPFRLNERLTIQQGVFLFPGDITTISFDDNLTLKYEGKESKKNLIRFMINVTKEERLNIIKKLHTMNISREVLFPGLEGFAESLKTGMAYLPELT